MPTTAPGGRGGRFAHAAACLSREPGLLASDAIHLRWMQSLLSPHGVYGPADVDVALARVFGVGVRPLRLEEALCEAMLAGWRSQQAARYLKPKTVRANEATVRAFVAASGVWPWEWR